MNDTDKAGRLRAYMEELPNALVLALTTAVTTLILAVLLNVVVGGDNRDHRIATRCFAHQTTTLIREIVQSSDTLRDRIDLSDYRPVSIEGLDCESVLEQPPVE